MLEKLFNITRLSLAISIAAAYITWLIGNENYHLVAQVFAIIGIIVGVFLEFIEKDKALIPLAIVGFLATVITIGIVYG